MALADTTVTRVPESAQEHGAAEFREHRWRQIRRRCAVGYGVLLAAFIFVVGLPTDREGLLIWTLAALGIHCLGRGWRSFRQVLLDWLPFTAVLIAYDLTRGIADGLGIRIRVTEPINADLWMFQGILPTTWMQDHFYVAGNPQWYDAIVTLIYTSHFIATPLLAAVLWIRNRERWLAFTRRVIVLALSGLSIYILYPAAPPWYAAREGIIDPTVRLSSRGWDVLGFERAGQVLSKGQAAANPVAAMPSLHVAYATLITLFLISRSPLWARPLLALYPPAMALILVYGGEHYVVDALFGYLLAALVMVGVGFFERLRQSRRDQPDMALSGPAVAEPRKATIDTDITSNRKLPELSTNSSDNSTLARDRPD